MDGVIRMESLWTENSRRLSIQAAVDSSGKLKVKARQRPDTVLVPGKDSLIYVPVPGPERTVEVNHLTWWQKLTTTVGTVSLLVLALAGILGLIIIVIVPFKRR